MVKKIIAGGAALSVLGIGLVATIAGAAPTTKTFVVDAIGANVGGGMGLKTGGYAKGTVSVNTATNEVCYRITDKGLGLIGAAHIHAGKKGVNGGIVVNLNVKAFNSMSMNPACVKVTPAVAKSLYKFPAAYYLNVHTSAFPNGAVRAQL